MQIESGNIVRLRCGYTPKVGRTLILDGKVIFEVGLAFINEDGTAIGGVEMFDVVEVLTARMEGQT